MVNTMAEIAFSLGLESVNIQVDVGLISRKPKRQFTLHKGERPGKMIWVGEHVSIFKAASSP